MQSKAGIAEHEYLNTAWVSFIPYFCLATHFLYNSVITRLLHQCKVIFNLLSSLLEVQRLSCCLHRETFLFKEHIRHDLSE